MEWDFVKNPEVEDINVVPEGFRSAYAQDAQTKKFTLKAEFKSLAEAYSGTFNNLKTEKAKRSQDNQRDAGNRHTIKAITDFMGENGIDFNAEDLSTIPTSLKAKVEELIASGKTGKQTAIDLAKIQADFQKKLAEAKTVGEGELGKMKTSLEKYMIRGSAATALAKANVLENGVDLLMPHIQSSTRMMQDANGEWSVVVVDGEGKARMNNAGNSMSVEDLVTEMKQRFPQSFKSEQKSGHGIQQNRNSNGLPKQVIENDASKMSPRQKIAAGLEARRQSGQGR